MANAFKDKLKRDEVVVVINPDHPSASLTEFVAWSRIRRRIHRLRARVRGDRARSGHVPGSARGGRSVHRAARKRRAASHHPLSGRGRGRRHGAARRVRARRRAGSSRPCATRDQRTTTTRCSSR